MIRWCLRWRRRQSRHCQCQPSTVVLDTSSNLKPVCKAKYMLRFFTHSELDASVAKKLSLAVRTVMRQEQVDMIAGDINGAAWRRQSGSDQRRNSTIEGAFELTNSAGPTTIVGTRWFQGNGPMCVGSSSHLVSKLSGIFACMVRSKFLFHLLHVSARLVNRTSPARPQVNPRGHPRKKPSWPSTQEHVTIHHPSRCRAHKVLSEKLDEHSNRFNTSGHQGAR